MVLGYHKACVVWVRERSKHVVAHISLCAHSLMGAIESGGIVVVVVLCKLVGEVLQFGLDVLTPLFICDVVIPSNNDIVGVCIVEMINELCEFFFSFCFVLFLFFIIIIISSPRLYTAPGRVFNTGVGVYIHNGKITFVGVDVDGNAIVLY